MSPAAKNAAAKCPAAEDRASESYLLIKQVKSGVGTKPKHRATLRALGLRGVGRERVLPDRPEIRGMIARVPHLVEVGTASAEQADVQHEAQSKALAARRAYAQKTDTKGEGQ